jgi:hypothetical protein
MVKDVVPAGKEPNSQGLDVPNPHPSIPPSHKHLVHISTRMNHRTRFKPLGERNLSFQFGGSYVEDL